MQAKNRGMSKYRAAICSGCGLAVLWACLWAAPAASGLTIERLFVEPGEEFPFLATDAAEEPANAVGGGNLVKVFNRAARVWQQAIQDDHTVTLYFGWSPLAAR